MAGSELLVFLSKKQSARPRRRLYSMNSLQSFYAQIKTEREDAQKEKESLVIMKSHLALPKSEILRNSIIDSYRSKHQDSHGHKRRPLVSLFIG
jgi:dsDNA-binding SOS-regulon protein